MEIEKNPNRPKVKLAFVLYGCATKPEYLEQIINCHSTWVKNASKYNFPVCNVVGEMPVEIPGTTVTMPSIGEDVASVSFKHWWGLLRVCSEICDPDFVCILGTDTYPIIKNLDILLNNFDCNTDIYLGGRGGDQGGLGEYVPFVSGGPLIILSRKTYERILPFCATMPSSWRHFIKKIWNKEQDDIMHCCDITTAAVMRALDIKPIFIVGFYYHKFSCKCTHDPFCKTMLPPESAYAYHYCDRENMQMLYYFEHKDNLI